ncbi:MAG TPA: 50S ribosomal protein L6 [Candidatus Poseidoniales archaeon]|nr:50S ribosomal protein L6 [Candidatus Poseidoniales archaeon]
MPIADSIQHAIAMPEGVSATMDGDTLSVQGPNASLKREFTSLTVNMQIDGSSIIIKTDLPRKIDKALAGTWKAHASNMVHGVQQDFEYRLKAVYSHFPMTLDAKGPNGTFMVKNYYGEKVPRTTPILDGVEITVMNRLEVIVTSADKEVAGQMAANIERLCGVGQRDRRVFQDGIYITSKGMRT